MNTTLKTLGGIIREARLSRGLTQGQVAYKMPASISYLSEIERGVKNPSFPMLEGIAEALGLTLGDLLVMLATAVDEEPEEVEEDEPWAVYLWPQVNEVKTAGSPYPNREEAEHWARYMRAAGHIYAEARPYEEVERE